MKKPILILLLLIPGLLSAKIWQINNSEDLKAALKLSQANDQIIINKGHYKVLNLEITKPLSINGVGFPILDAELKGEIFIVKSNDVKISGIRFVNIGETSMIDWAAVKVLESENVKVTGNDFRNCYFAVYLSSSNKCKVSKNNIKGTPKEEQTTGNGIHAWKCDEIEISENYVEGHRDGIYFEFVTNSKIFGNYSTKNIRYGLHFMFSHQDEYYKNNFVNNGAGVAVMYSKKVKMHENIFNKNWGGSAYGILLKDITDSDIIHNHFLDNTVGIYMEGCSRMNIKQCIIEQNGIGLRIQANCDENHITINNFKANTFDLATNGSVVFNYLENNYWDKYQGYDLNKDGHGDVAYRPVSMFSTLVERMPQVMILLRSFTVTLLDKIERIIPSFTPENLKDENPQMKPNEINAIELKA